MGRSKHYTIPLFHVHWTVEKHELCLKVVFLFQGFMCLTTVEIIRKKGNILHYSQSKSGGCFMKQNNHDYVEIVGLVILKKMGFKML